MNLMAFRDGTIFKQLFREIEPDLDRMREKLGRKLRIMEVCGTHSVSFSKSGVRDILAPYVDLISGPGCPVCVTDQSEIDQMVAYSRLKDVIVTTFGDMMKVPGFRSSLEQEKSKGADVRIVISASQAVDIARQNPSKKVVFLGVGFETTAPGIAVSMIKAKEEKIGNYFVYTAHKLTPPALNILLMDGEHRLDGFLLPGHVSVIIGRSGWAYLEKMNVPAVIGGFEPIDLIISVGILARELELPRRRVLNLYPRVVTEEGNPRAQRVLTESFTVSDAIWRGFGRIEQSGLAIHPDYVEFNAKSKLETEKPVTRVIRGCRCGEIVKGKESPFDCKLFGKACTPAHPLGPCMVSSEGACSTYYKYERNKESIRLS